MYQRRVDISQESKTQAGQVMIENECGRMDSEQLQLEDKRISIALMSSYVVLIVQYFILVSVDLMGTTMGRTVQLLSKIIVGTAFAYALPIALRRNKKRCIGTYLAGVSTFLVHYEKFPENHVYQQQLVFPLFFMCLPAFIYSSTIYDWKVLKGVMKRASYVVFCIGVLLGVMLFSGRVSVGAYSMPLSYYLLLPALMFIDQFLDRPSLKDVVFALLLMLLILAVGARGPIMCIFAFVILKLIGPHKRLGHTNVFAYLILLCLVMVTALSLDQLLAYLYQILGRFGITSRNISLFLQPQLYLSDRDILFSRVIDEIIDSPFIGIGIGGDRRVLDGDYVHNLLIELIADYGIPLGSIFVFMLVLLMSRFFLSRNKDQYDMFAVWLTIGMVPKLVSGSYLESMNFWIVLGLMSSGVVTRRRHP